MAIPIKELTVFREPVRSTLIIYTGGNWETDREWFLTSAKVNARHLGHPRRYIVYEDRNGTMNNHEGNGHEYGLQAGDQKHYPTSEVYTEFSNWLEANVLNFIKAQQ